MVCNAKTASLVAGVFQQAALVLAIRYSKLHNEDSKVPYLSSVVVAASEVFKLLLSYIIELINKSSAGKKDQDGSHDQTTSSEPRRASRPAHVLMNMIPRLNNQESLKLIIPAALYLFQNNLLFVALNNLSVPVYQVTNQGKLLTTAIISRIMLKKQINAMQYFSIALLAGGVAVIHLSEHRKASEVTEHQQNQTLGLLAVLMSCVTSGFAGVYFEFISKSSSETGEKQSVYCRNFQLAYWSFLLAILHIVLSKDRELIKNNGLFQGFDIIVVLVVVMQGMTGFIVGLMIHFADAVLKGFAISVAAVVATLISIVLFNTKVNATFFAGTFMVGAAVNMYTYFDKKYRANVEVQTSSGPRRSLDILSFMISRSVLKVAVVAFCLINLFTFQPGLKNLGEQLKPSTESMPLDYKNDNEFENISSGLNEVKATMPALNSTENNATIATTPVSNSTENNVTIATTSVSNLTENNATIATSPVSNSTENNFTSYTAQEEGTVVVKEAHPKTNHSTHQTAQKDSKSMAVLGNSSQEFAFRDLSEFSVRKIGPIYKTSLNKRLEEANCLDFACSKNETLCENTANVTTNYDGPEPPCCIHILRDMARIFDETMFNLRLDYSAGFGSLLGIIRENRFIPWTIDNDYIIPSTDVMNALVSLWDAQKTGMTHIFQGINRICITPGYADGKLSKWKVPPPDPLTTPNHAELWARGYPYIDFYVGKKVSSSPGYRSSNIPPYESSKTMFQEISPCRHLLSDTFPTKRVKVYGGEFSQRIPANPEQFLRTYYGRSWKIPVADKNPHGKPNICPYPATYK